MRPHSANPDGNRIQKVGGGEGRRTDTTHTTMSDSGQSANTSARIARGNRLDGGEHGASLAQQQQTQAQSEQQAQNDDQQEQQRQDDLVVNAVPAVAVAIPVKRMSVEEPSGPAFSDTDSRNGNGNDIDSAETTALTAAPAIKKTILKRVAVWDSVPDEIFIAVMANLDSVDLKRVGLVCHRFNRVIKDDSMWKSALQAFWGAVPVPSCRLEVTWREDYIARKELLKSWHRGRCISNLFDARVGKIQHIDPVFESDQCLMFAQDNGTFHQADFQSGKVERDAFLKCSVSEEFDSPVSVMAYSKYRIVAGHSNGNVTAFTQGGRSSESTVYRRQRVQNVHLGGAVRSVSIGVLPSAFPAIVASPSIRDLAGKTDHEKLPDVVVSGGDDGTVVLVAGFATNDTERRRSLFDAKSPVTSLLHSFHSHRPVIVAGTENGQIFVQFLNTALMNALRKIDEPIYAQTIPAVITLAIHTTPFSAVVPKPITRLQMSSCFQYVLTASSGGTVKMVDLTNGKVVAGFSHDCEMNLGNGGGTSGSSSSGSSSSSGGGGGAAPNPKRDVRPGLPPMSLTIPGQAAPLIAATASNAPGSSADADQETYGLSALAWRGDVKQGMVVTGARDGSMKIWMLRLVQGSSADNNNNKGQHGVVPLRTIDGAHLDSIMCLKMDEFKIVSASGDGYVRVWDTVSFGCLRTLNAKAPRNNMGVIPPPPKLELIADADEEGGAGAGEDPYAVSISALRAGNLKSIGGRHRFDVKCLVVGEYEIALSIGNQIKWWNFRPDRQPQMLVAKAKKLRKPAGAPIYSKAPTRQDRLDLLYESATSEQRVRLEAQTSARATRNQVDWNTRSNTANGVTSLTDEELLQVALMMSRDAEEIELRRRGQLFDVDDEAAAIAASLSSSDLSLAAGVVMAQPQPFGRASSSARHGHASGNNEISEVGMFDMDSELELNLETHPPLTATKAITTTTAATTGRTRTMSMAAPVTSVWGRPVAAAAVGGGSGGGTAPPPLSFASIVASSSL